MNIDEYRARKAQESAETQNQVEGVTVSAEVIEGATTIAEQPVQTQNEAGSTPPENPTDTTAQTVPQAIEIDGVEVPIDELRQGYLRQGDYTRKTQDLARIKQETEIANAYYNAIHSDPEFAEGIARRFDLPFMSPEQLQNQQINHKYQTLLLEREIEQLQAKHGNVNIPEVLRVAKEKQSTSLEDAYILHKATTQTATAPADMEAIKTQIRQEITAELQSKVDTGTIIGTGGSAKQIQQAGPELSPAELKVAVNMKMTPAEYAKWKNA